MSWNYPTERIPDERDTESYFHALWDVLLGLGIQDGHCKMYDPLTIHGDMADTYVFDLKDGGRHHPFTSLKQLRKDALEEVVEAIKQEMKEPNPYNEVLAI